MAQDERLRFSFTHRGQVVNVEIALTAESHAVSANHPFPISWAGRRNSHMIKRAAEFRHGLFPS
jgi:hypothetical protein